MYANGGSHGKSEGTAFDLVARATRRPGPPGSGRSVRPERKSLSSFPSGRDGQGQTTSAKSPCLLLAAGRPHSQSPVSSLRSVRSVSAGGRERRSGGCGFTAGPGGGAERKPAPAPPGAARLFWRILARGERPEDKRTGQDTLLPPEHGFSFGSARVGVAVPLRKESRRRPSTAPPSLPRISFLARLCARENKRGWEKISSRSGEARRTGPVGRTPRLGATFPRGGRRNGAAG